MGRAYVRAFLSDGAKVVAADKSWAGTDDFKEELKGHETNILIAEMDSAAVAAIAP